MVLQWLVLLVLIGAIIIGIYLVANSSTEFAEPDTDATGARRWQNHSSQEVVEYPNGFRFEHDRGNWIANNWRIASVSDVAQSAGLGRVLALGFIGALVWKPDPHVLVVYENQAPVKGETITPGGRVASISSELARLAELHQLRVLTDQEFTDAKRILLEGERD